MGVVLHALWPDSHHIPFYLHYYTLIPVDKPYLGNLFLCRPWVCLPDIYQGPNQPYVLTPLESTYSALWILSNCAALASSQQYLFPNLVRACPSFSTAAMWVIVHCIAQTENIATFKEREKSFSTKQGQREAIPSNLEVYVLKNINKLLRT